MYPSNCCALHEPAQTIKHVFHNSIINVNTNDGNIQCVDNNNNSFNNNNNNQLAVLLHLSHEIYPSLNSYK